MAKHYYGVNIGAAPTDAGTTVGTSTGNKDVELVITDSVTGMSKTKVVEAVKKLMMYIIRDDAPA